MLRSRSTLDRSMLSLPCRKQNNSDRGVFPVGNRKREDMEEKDMEIKEVNCSVCNHPLNISKENVYVAKNVKNLLFGNEDWSATDCPYCGCQNLLKRRFEKAVK